MIEEVNHNAYKLAKESYERLCPWRAWALDPIPDDARAFRNTRDGLYFYIVPKNGANWSGYLGGVFRLPGRPKQAVGSVIQNAALALKLRYMDLTCYSTVFAVWFNAGFEVRACEPWLDSKAPAGWRSTYGRPAGVFTMRLQLPMTVPAPGLVSLLR